MSEIERKEKAPRMEDASNANSPSVAQDRSKPKQTFGMALVNAVVGFCKVSLAPAIVYVLLIAWYTSAGATGAEEHRILWLACKCMFAVTTINSLAFWYFGMHRLAIAGGIAWGGYCVVILLSVIAIVNH